MQKYITIYFLIISACFSGYFITKYRNAKKIFEKEFSYSSASASEIYMVWGLMDGKIPSKEIWPENSYSLDKMIYTKLSGSNNKFSTSLKLPVGSDLYYWMVQRKDKAGNETDIWDSGGGNKEYFRYTFSDHGFFKPGYFIFFAGFIPLLLFYLRNRNRAIPRDVVQQYKVKDYIPQLDSIRAIAVVLVIIHHWVPKKSILNFFDNGPLGVNIFFVLSGFLITGILVKAKKQAEEHGLKKTAVFRNFYIRRTLRIFPIYYLMLLIMWFINDHEIKANGSYYFTYTSNYLFYSQQFFPARLAHLWSLGVEEQFYIFWPWLIVLANQKLLPYLIALFPVIGISSNYIFTGSGWWVGILTFSCFDAFAIGGFLSWLIAYRQDIITKLRPVYKWACLLILALIIADRFSYAYLPARTLHSLLAISLIYYCLFVNNNVVANYILNNKWLIRIGKISYGVYLYHLFIPELWGAVIKKSASWNIDLLYNKAMPESIRPVWLFVQHFSVLMIICILSWLLIEKPINNLKKRFENKTPAIN